MNRFLHFPRKLALWSISLMTAAASITSFAESYRALYLWAVNHSVPGFWANVWPLQIDVFIAIGEVALFVGLVDGWHHRKRWFPWAVALTGLAVSVAGNIGHAPTSDFATRMTFAVPPLTAFASLIVGMGVLKRVVDLYSRPVSGTEETAPEAAPEAASGYRTVTAEPVTPERAQRAISRPSRAATSRRELPEVLAEAEQKFGPAVSVGKLPGVREIRSELGVGQARAGTVQEHLAALVAEADAALPVPDAPATNALPAEFDTETFQTVGHMGAGQRVQAFSQLPYTPQTR